MNAALDAECDAEFARVHARIMQSTQREGEKVLRAAFTAGISFGLELGKRLMNGDSLDLSAKSADQIAFEKAMAPRENPAHPKFRDHNCARCGDGARACKQGNPSQCEYPHARND